MEILDKYLELEKKLIALGDQIIEEIDLKGQIEIANSREALLRNQYLLFIRFSVNFFTKRAKFITKIISEDKFSKEEKGIIRTIFRGLIEIISKIEYGKKNKESFVKNYLWDQLKTSLLSLYLSAKDGQENLSIPKEAQFWYESLQSLEVELPNLEKLICDYTEYQLTIFNLNQSGRDYSNIDKQLKFPTTKELIKSYWNDEEPPSKIDAYMWYGILSNQIHSSLLYEGYEVKTIDFQLLGFLIMLHLKFLYSIKQELSENLKDEIDTLEKEIKKESNNFITSWKIKKV